MYGQPPPPLRPGAPAPAWGSVTTAVHAKRGNINALHSKVYTAWINSQLREANIRIESCLADLKTGVVLIRLIESLTKTTCPFHYQPNPTNRTFMIDNMAIALRFLGMHVPGLAIAPADVVDGNEQVILGLIWRLILRWQNVLEETRGEVGEEGVSQSVVKKTKDAKAKLLDWIRGKVGQYPHVRITNDFVESFDNGMALCALVHAFDPNILAYEMLDPTRKLDNLALGMQLAEQYMGIPRMMDAEDVAEADDKAMMVYLYEFPKAFLARLDAAQGELGDQAAAAAAAAASAAAAAEEARRQREGEDLRRRLAAEEEARRRAEEEAARRRAAEEEAWRRAQEEERMRQQAQMDYAQQLEAQRLAAEQERMRMFQQFQAQQQPVQGAPQVITNTVVIREHSNIGRLTVEVVKARNLKAQDPLVPHANPYAVVQVERQKERTHKEKHTLSPNWHEVFQFYVSEPYASVDVCIFDFTHIIQDYFMGKVEFPCNKLEYDKTVEGWFPLQPLHMGKAVGGEIYLKMTLRKG